MEVSVPAVESKVQVIAEPEPKVDVPISVVSRLMIKVPAPLSEVSMPFVPPDTVRVAPKAVVDEPESPAKVIVELVSSLLSMDVPRVVTSVLPATERPVPAKLVKVLPPTVKEPTEAEPVTLALVETKRYPVVVDPETLALVETFKNPVEVEPVTLALVKTFKYPVEVEPEVVVFPATVKLPVVEKLVAVPDERMVLPATLRLAPIDKAPETEPEPTTSSATVGAVVPIPSLPEKDAVPEVKIC